MLIFPPVPESHGDLLEDAGNRDSKEPSKHSEEFCAREEREQGHNGMKASGFAENAWCQNLHNDNSLTKRHIHSHYQHHHPPLRQSRQDTKSFYHIGTYHRDKIEEKEERSQQSGILNVQQRESNAGTQGSYECKQQRAPKVPAHTLIEGVQQEIDGAPLSCRSFEAEPTNDARAIKDKVDTECDHEDEVDDVGEQPDQERKCP